MEGKRKEKDIIGGFKEIEVKDEQVTPRGLL